MICLSVDDCENVFELEIFFTGVRNSINDADHKPF